MTDPLFGSRGRTEFIQQFIAGPSFTIYVPNAFIGGRQPLAPRKLPPSLLSVDQPEREDPLILFLDPDARPPEQFLRRPKLPAQLLSIDNPPNTDDDRTQRFASIIGTWFQAPTQPQLRRLNPALLTTPAATAAGNLFSQGTSLGTLVGQALASANFNAAGAAVGTLAGASLDPAVLNAAGVASAKAVGAALDKAVLNAAGAATGIFTGSALDKAALNAPGVATAKGTGAALDKGVLNAAGVASAIAVGATASSTNSGALSTAGTATATATGAAKAAAVFLAAGHATGILVGVPTSPARRNLDGWRPDLRKLRLKREEEELLILASALGPILHELRAQ